MLYNVWSIPTPLGVRQFEWHSVKLNGAPLDKEAAEELRHLSSVDARTPDQDAYVHYVIEPTALTDEDVRVIQATAIDRYISPARVDELVALVRAGYALSAIIAAVRETVYAMNKQIMIPPTSRE